ncbi:MAG: zinc-ribbon domain-containing protein [Anaerolineae bacterium]|nr:zinc-ribbon domain-containing protein [Anaerolineae bacterium]
MIIFGTRVRQKTIGEGEFYCPHCQSMCGYEHKSARQFFTLYFIPVIPIKQLGEFIMCENCGGTFKAEARFLRSSPAASGQQNRTEDLAALLNSVKAKLEKGVSIDYLVRDLTSAGLNYDMARQTVENAAGEGRRVCEACGLTYTATASTCTECGGRLQ